MKPNPYVQVALMYLRRPMVHLCVAVAVLIGLPLPIWFTHGQEAALRDRFAMARVLLVLVFCAAVLTVYLLQQYTHPRTRLLPGFHRANLTVAAVLVLAIFLGIPALLAGAWGHWELALGCVALVSSLSVLVAWAICLSSGVLMVLAFLVWMALILSGLPELRVPYMETALSPPPSLALALLGVAGLAIVALGWRLTRLHEESPEYERSGQWAIDYGGATVRARTTTWTVVPREGFWLRQCDRHVERLLRSGPAGWGWSIRRWRLMPVWPCLAVGLAIAGVMVFIFQLVPAPVRASKLPPPFGWAYAMSLPLILTSRELQRRYLGQAWLKPVTRAQLFRQLAAGLVGEVVLLGLVLGAGSIGLAWLTTPQPVSLLGAGTTGAMCLAIALLACACGLWFMRYRSVWGRFTGLMLASYGALFAMIVSDQRLLGLGPRLLLIGGFLLAGGLVLWDGYRRWLAADLE